jgi:hypothetical protein
MRGKQQMLRRVGYMLVCWLLISTSITAHADTLDEGLANLEAVSIFYQLFVQSGLSDELDGNYTLFIPDNKTISQTRLICSSALSPIISLRHRKTSKALLNKPNS